MIQKKKKKKRILCLPLAKKKQFRGWVKEWVWVSHNQPPQESVRMWTHWTKTAVELYCWQIRSPEAHWWETAALRIWSCLRAPSLPASSKLPGVPSSAPSFPASSKLPAVPSSAPSLPASSKLPGVPSSAPSLPASSKLQAVPQLSTFLPSLFQAASGPRAQHLPSRPLPSHEREPRAGASKGGEADLAFIQRTGLQKMASAPLEKASADTWRE